MSNELVSVIMPTYNSGKFLSRTIDSILGQTYQNWELLISDDGSTDEQTLQMLKDYSEKDKRVRVNYLKGNNGPGCARNDGIKRANGRYIAFCDSDDRWFPEKLEKQIALIKNCRELAGCAGTALHLALVMKPGGTVIQIKRNSPLDDNGDVQCLINMAKGLDSVFISGSCETRKTTHWSNVPQIICVTKYMKQFFDENNFIYTQEDLAIDKKENDAYVKVLESLPNTKTFASVLKSKFIKITSCFIPGRLTRKRYRNFMKEHLHV